MTSSLNRRMKHPLLLWIGFVVLFWLLYSTTLVQTMYYENQRLHFCFTISMIFLRICYFQLLFEYIKQTSTYRRGWNNAVYVFMITGNGFYCLIPNRILQIESTKRGYIYIYISRNWCFQWSMEPILHIIRVI